MGSPKSNEVDWGVKGNRQESGSPQVKAVGCALVMCVYLVFIAGGMGEVT